ncbi:metal-dependent hydrolase [Leptospira gomenensis]|uniref:Metal-dependent hydrolase n=1 Tax=Leptospira gomenensis TaxID=2484974 RepID=A0A5F1Z112_9LEPT|nr:metal-dependent hydrolase [Leptospira gomenensis]TGK29080.1 metal-dependent hydrolase [Leptospira gomenensis]TGK41944.1 metal-dependent hydrolase [Leptospira gomenensis]TGK45048.1 metal-dependent hydrolase [Leptospira gomenensis]TGK67374.1 metal-dependent hydrolase [Leptospira gomenensis]
MSTELKSKKRTFKPIDSRQPTVRKMDFETMSDLPSHYFAGNSFITHMINAYHILFPEGERFFIRSVKAFSDRVVDPQLQTNIKAFIGQEVQHGKEHEKVLEILAQQGRPVKRFIRFFEWSAFRVMLPFFEFFFGKKLKLSVTAGMEHYTATMGEITLRHGFHEKTYGEMRNLLLWHACEEIEHKSVAYDLLQTVSNSYTLRIFGFFLASWIFWGYVVFFQHWFLLTDPGIGWKKYFQDMNSSREYGRILIAETAKAFFLYLKPGFHPAQTGGYEMEDRALSTII